MSTVASTLGLRINLRNRPEAAAYRGLSSGANPSRFENEDESEGRKMTDLVSQHCEACHRDAPHATDSEIAKYLPQIPEWERIEEDGKRAFPGHGNPRDEEFARLKRENARLKSEVVILRKAAGILSRGPYRDTG